MQVEMTQRTISTKDIMDLRARTGAGMMDCKKALEEANGDLPLAGEILRKKGIAKAEKRAGRDASQGLVQIENAPDGSAAAMVELNCETDFVARTDEFKSFVHDIALHIAALKPRFVSIADVPEEYVASEKSIYEAQAQDIPEHARERAIEGKLKKHLASICLMEQEYVRDQGEKKPRTIEDLRVAATSSLGENVSIRRFVVFELGQ